MIELITYLQCFKLLCDLACAVTKLHVLKIHQLLVNLKLDFDLFIYFLKYVRLMFI